MKKIFLFVCSLSLFFMAVGQSVAFDAQMPETYVKVSVNKSQLHDLSLNFSVDDVKRHADGTFDVKLCIGSKEYEAFKATGIPYTILSTPKANVNMANSYYQFSQQWNRYPTYSTYLATMDTFQSQFPQLCQIDTILAQTPNNHSILVAHISNNLQDRGTKPAVFYSSTIHGDEPVGYYMMIRLIHYLLNNYATDATVQDLVDNVDIWICPIENPDGTYYTSDNTLNESPYSTRYNYNGIDLNRSYPEIGAVTAMRDLEPEVQAMYNFGAAHDFTLSANLHGGAEVFNYPWDTWPSYYRTHADDDWWYYVGRKFADTCHAHSYYYMYEEDNGVTEGGDWYVITGSRQDCYNYYLQCREVTIEVSNDKVVNSSYLPYYWGFIYRSFLNYIKEATYGIHGVVTDSITGQPLDATVVVENHDDNVSFVNTVMPAGAYHRPIKGGTYQVTYSAQGYYPKTLTLTATDGATLTQDVELVPYGYGVENRPQLMVEVYPNPTSDILQIRCPQLDGCKAELILYNAAGQKVFAQSLNEKNTIVNMESYPQGIYLVKIVADKLTYIGKVVKE
ncbi:MAG: T9SS type A sorting domain-containing protein [Bacteroidales bacterium]|nr:T9SS type A sorting domain-containing protein [Bacteroidales bacterium]